MGCVGIECLYVSGVDGVWEAMFTYFVYGIKDVRCEVFALFDYRFYQCS